MAHSALQHWLCRIYAAMLHAYPAAFRRRYAAEMAQVFRDRCRYVAQTRGLPGLCRFIAGSAADWFVTTVREGVASVDASAQLTSAGGPPLDGVPTFYICGKDAPDRGSLMSGGVLAIATLFGISFAIGHTNAHRLLIGSHHPSRSHLLPAPTAAEPRDLDAEVKVNPYLEDRPMSAYFRLILVLGALDTDRDGSISANEIENSAKALRTLDKDRDGKLSAEECGGRFPDPQTASADEERLRVAFMRVHPVLAVLDADHDGEISPAELKNAPAALRTLDRNGDKQLTENELLPDPRTSTLIYLMAVLDRNGDGKLSIEERNRRIGDPFRGLLERADRNQDGFVTPDELAAEILRRPPPPPH